MTHEPLISVCIPAFNVENTLARCVDSVLRQKYESCEVIIVDDGSTDGTFNICSDLAENYENITVFHQENRGQAAARNRAASKVKGRYILFLDSDDELEPNSLQLLSMAIDKTDADIIFFDTTAVDFTGNKTPQPELFPGATAEINWISKNDVLVNFLTGKHPFLLNAMWIHLVKTDLAQAALEEENATHLRWGEDIIQNISLYSEAETFAYLRAPIHLYVENSKSVLHTIDPEKLWADAREVKEVVREFALKIPFDEEKRAEVEREISKHEAAFIVSIVAYASCNLSVARAKEVFKSIRASALFQRLRGKRGLELSRLQRIAWMMLLGGACFDSLLFFLGSLRARQRSLKNAKLSKK